MGGTNVAGSSSAGGGGGGVILLIYGPGGYLQGSYDDLGGCTASVAEGDIDCGGHGQVVTQQYENQPPIPYSQSPSQERTTTTPTTPRELDGVSSFVSLAGMNATSSAGSNDLFSGTCGLNGLFSTSSCFGIQQNLVVAAVGAPHDPLFWVQNTLQLVWSGSGTTWNVSHSAEIWACSDSNEVAVGCSSSSTGATWCSYGCGTALLNYNYSIRLPASVTLTTTTSKGAISFGSNFGTLSPLVSSPLHSSTDYVIFSPTPSPGVQLPRVSKSSACSRVLKLPFQVQKVQLQILLIILTAQDRIRSLRVRYHILALPPRTSRVPLSHRLI